MRSMASVRAHNDRDECVRAFTVYCTCIIRLCKYLTSHSWTFDKTLYKTAETRSIWDKSLICGSPYKIVFCDTFRPGYVH